MQSSQRAFTLIELLLVVVILSVLAAMVIPKLVGASLEARESVLRNNLRLVRTQIELYKLQHEGMYPGFARQQDGSLSAWNGQAFVLQLVGTTNSDGMLGLPGCGPYLERFPSNEFTFIAQYAAMVEEGQPDGNEYGWAFDPDTGEFHANDSDSEHQSW